MRKIFLPVRNIFNGNQLHYNHLLMNKSGLILFRQVEFDVESAQIMGM